IKPAVLLDAVRPLVGDGLSTSEGETWRRHRRLMGPELAPGAIARYADAMTECARAAVLDLHEGQIVDVAREMTRITMRIVGRALFDVEVLDDAGELSSALTCALRWVDERMGSASWALRLRVASALGRWPGSQSVVERIRSPGATNRELAASLA